MNDLTELIEANKRANAIIGQQADEMKGLQDKIDKLEEDKEYAYKTIKEYEEIVGYSVNEAFRMGWDMARAKMKWFK